MASLPTTPDLVTARWLTDVLRASHAISAPTQVVGVHHERIAEGVGFLSCLYRLRLVLDGPGPDSLILKVPTDTAYLQLAQATGAYEREMAFYASVAPLAPLRTPTAHLAALDSDGAGFVLLLEDLGHLDSPDHVDGLPYDRVVTVLDELAGFHAWGWDLVPEAARNEAFPSIDGAEVAGLYAMAVPAGWSTHQQHGRAVAPAGMDAFVGEFALRLPALLASLVAPTTLVNGDLRVDNLFFHPDGSPTTVDFQLAMRAAGIWDVAYLIGQGMTRQERLGRERELVDGYVDALRAAGVTGYGSEQAWTQFRHAAAVQIVFPLAAMLSWDTINERARELLHVLTERSFSIIEDTDALADLPT